MIAFLSVVAAGIFVSVLSQFIEWLFVLRTEDYKVSTTILLIYTCDIYRAIQCIGSDHPLDTHHVDVVIIIHFIFSLPRHGRPKWLK